MPASLPIAIELVKFVQRNRSEGRYKMMELTSGVGTIVAVSGLSTNNNKTNNNTCPSDGSVTSPNHHFIKRINEPSKGQQTQNTQSILQSHMEHQHQQDQRQQEIDGLPTIVPSPKPNQVSTVLLYGIPIVSLYIESQERLCLAQISNTLLKQFSYNEIHNRRVALGITCVQCTPVQLEILRRAGAMPVSSRRCGMITRREAERLCKSFLGDNAPPRLPDDFAFSVHHKCAWGCRGSFLPSRYNSSRAKCIKCSYCGLFFSPNKFIFHSHRIGPGDKYVQPDAANFNSWRRHMKLSGNPPEEIIHAWEDVKAMFNGGTRKRLMTSTHSPPSLTVGATTVTTGTTSSSSSSSSSSVAAQSPKRLKESSPGRTGPTSTSAAGQFPLRPLNIHHHTTAAGNGTLSTANQIATLPVGTTPTSDISLPFSRNFMMDYMWHAHAQNKASNSHFHFPNCTLPWIKGSAGSFIFGANNNNNPVTRSPTQDQTLTSSTNPETSISNTSPTASHERFDSPQNTYGATVPEVKTISGFYNNSAFKPVIQVNRSASSYTAATTTLALETVAAVAAAAAAAANSFDSEQKSLSRVPAPATPHIKESFSSDDEMVDIETTEEEEKPFELIDHQRIKQLKKNEHNENRHHIADSLLDAPIEVDTSSDELTWKGLMKKEQPIHNLDGCQIQTPTSSLLSHSPTSSINSEHHISFQLANKSTSSTPDVILTDSPRPGITTLDHRQNCSPEQQRNVAAVIASAFSHHRHHSHHQHLHQHQHQHQQHPSHHQSPQSPQLPPPLSSSVSASAINGSPTTSPSAAAAAAASSLVNGRMTTDINSNSSVLFGAISGGNNPKNNSPFLNTNNNLTSNSSSTNSLVINNTPTIPPCVNNEFWSVARLSFNRPPIDYNTHHRLPISAAFHRHHHDITKHFQAFRHHGHETPTQTNGVG